MSGAPSSKRGKKGATGSGSTDEAVKDELSKEEAKIARFLRLSCPTKQGNLMGMKVEFFLGQKLVDALMESKWGPQQGKNPAPFLASRTACVAFMQRLMNKQMFYRTVKIYKETADEPATKVRSPENR